MRVGGKEAEAVHASRESPLTHGFGSPMAWVASAGLRPPSQITGKHHSEKEAPQALMVTAKTQPESTALVRSPATLRSRRRRE